MWQKKAGEKQLLQLGYFSCCQKNSFQSGLSSGSEEPLEEGAAREDPQAGWITLLDPLRLKYYWKKEDFFVLSEAQWLFLDLKHSADSL